VLIGTIGFVVLRSQPGTPVVSNSAEIVDEVLAGGGFLKYLSGISPEGLQLQVTLNSSSSNRVQSHGEVAVQIELLNTLNQNVSTTVVESQNMSGWNEGDFFCGENQSHSLVGFALFEGHVSPENISAAGSPLQLAAPVAVPCPISLGLNDT